MDGEGVEELVGEDASYDPSQRHAGGSDGVQTWRKVVWSGVVEGNVA
jgi:hypothetical protein